MRPMLNRLLILPIVLILLGPGPLRADTSQPDPSGRVAQLRALLASEQGAAILDLLGDPKVRQAIIQDPVTVDESQSRQSTAGEMMDDTLTNIRARLWQVATRLAAIPGELAAVPVRAQSSLPGHELLRLFGFVLVFLAGGIVARWLLFRAARRWRAHFDELALATAWERARAAVERLVFGLLLIGAFAAGSMGAFLLFTWPPATGSIILGYLLAFTATRLSLTATRFFLAPGAERLRLVRVSTETAWFWHRWTTRVVGTAAVGWQTILTLQSLGVSPAGADVLLQLLLLLLAILGICIVWTMPGDSNERVRGAIPRLLVSLALVLDWLLFLMGATELGWTLLILAAIPVVTSILSRSIATVMCGDMTDADIGHSPHAAIAERTMQAVVVVIGAAILVRVWRIDMVAMSNMDTPMMRIGRGLLEALVILVVSDLLWQVVRVLIDERLAGEQPPIDALDDDERRRRARLRTLLPVCATLRCSSFWSWRR